MYFEIRSLQTKVSKGFLKIGRCNVNQSELAEAIGIGQSHISAIEKGEKEIGAAVLFRLAKFFGKSMEWILTGADEN